MNKSQAMLLAKTQKIILIASGIVQQKEHLIQHSTIYIQPLQYLSKPA